MLLALCISREVEKPVELGTLRVCLGLGGPMCPPRAAPPAADLCLSQPYSSRPKQKGGTRIAEAVLDVATHLRMLLKPWEYRPKACQCGCVSLHLHGLRERHPRQLVFDGEPIPVVNIAVFLCAACGATWRVLPAFLARCLWRTWDVVEREALAKPRPHGDPPVPARTVQRWRTRLARLARLPIQALVVAGGELRRLAERVGLEATRLELLLASGVSLAALAALLHRVAPGVRLM